MSGRNIIDSIEIVTQHHSSLVGFVKSHLLFRLCSNFAVFNHSCLYAPVAVLPECSRACLQICVQLKDSAALLVDADSSYNGHEQTSLSLLNRMAASSDRHG